jgi:hypothetical protein
MNANAPSSALAPPADTGDFAGELLERRRRRRIPRMTVVLACLVVVGAVFVGGIEAQKSLGSSSSSTATGFAGARVGFAGFRGGAGATAGATAGQAGATGGIGGGFNATTGTVTLIKGSTLYVTDASGNTVLVKTSGTASVTKTVTATVSAIHPGDTVSFTGSAASDGSFAPRTITITSASNG